MTMRIQLVYKNQEFPIVVEDEDRLAVLFDLLREITPLSVETCRMIYKGKKLPAYAVAKDVLVDGAKVLLIGSTQTDVDIVRSARADPLVKGFDALERDEKLRRKRTKRLQQSFWGTKQHKEYKFCSIKAEFKYTTPTPYDAEALLQKLATDPAIVKIMTERKFVVGTLTEMSPAEAQERMRQEGKNGDLLGFNENAGGRIVLRIRTDDVKGFRPYYDLINTLIHELTHNVFGPHDDKFWALFRELKAEYDRFHDGWSRNGRTVGNHGTFHGFANDSDDDEVVAGPLGGNVVDRATARELAVQRALDRSAQAAQPPRATSSGKPAPAAVEGERSRSPPVTAQQEESPSPRAAHCPACMPSSSSTSVPVPVEAHSFTKAVSPEDTQSAPPAKSTDEAANERKPMDIDTETAATPLATETLPARIVPMEIDDTEFVADGIDSSGLQWVRDFQGAVGRLPAEAQSTLRAVVRNLKLHPENPKFRSVKAVAPRVRALQEAGGSRCMELLGFECGREEFTMHSRRMDVGKFHMAYEILEP